MIVDLPAAILPSEKQRNDTLFQMHRKSTRWKYTNLRSVSFWSDSRHASATMETRQASIFLVCQQTDENFYSEESPLNRFTVSSFSSSGATVVVALGVFRANKIICTHIISLFGATCRTKRQEIWSAWMSGMIVFKRDRTSSSRSSPLENV